jgi:multidrug efflux pump subunit AcrA (membrane-fusion protein)
MALKSPIDGLVEAIGVGPGEWADPQKPEGLVTVVKNDPLWVEMHLPVEQSQKIKKGDGLTVKHAGDAQPAEAKVIFITPVSDAASGTALVRLELPNPQDRPSGLSVSVMLPETVVAAAADGR